jgi:hypothetical protein
MQSVTVDGKTYGVAHAFSDVRAIIDFDGLFVFVDRNPDGTWDLSGVPARQDEKPVLAELVAPMRDQSVVKVTPPES